jgi:hypothetical protein
MTRSHALFVVFGFVERSKIEILPPSLVELPSRRDEEIIGLVRYNLCRVVICLPR